MSAAAETRGTPGGRYEILDERALDRLATELHGSRLIVRHFVDDFVAGWDVKLNRLHSACLAHDAAEAYVTLLSIRTSSEMIGAIALAKTAGRLQGYASDGHIDECCRAQPDLAAIGARTLAVLRDPALRADRLS